MLFSVALASLFGCGGGSTSSVTSTQTKGLAVSDFYNNRVLIYDAPFSTNESATIVLGETNFTTGGVPNYGSANAFYGPEGLAKDSSGNLYVADSENCRVLQFKPPFTNGMNASVAIGQPDLTTSSCPGTGAPTSVTLDNKGNLWVTSASNSEVVEFVPPFSNGMAATLVIGQYGLVGAGPGACNQGGTPTASTLCGPIAAAFDPNGNLWVSDDGNSRVLKYAPPFSTGMAASLELGQPAATAFTSGKANNGGISATSVQNPWSLTFDASGDLWLADSANNRILEYVPPFTNGMTAALVIGQSNFTHGDTNRGGSPTANTLNDPYALNFDADGNLSVADTNNNRVLIFAPPFASGMNASIVLGQTNPNNRAANQGGSSTAEANTLYEPIGLLSF
jgi:hypothetical protein